MQNFNCFDKDNYDVTLIFHIVSHSIAAAFKELFVQ